MYRCCLISLLLCFVATDVTACNRQCNKDESKANPAENAANENQVFAEIVSIINDVCKQNQANGQSMCNHTAVLPAGIFTEKPINVTLKYSDIELVQRDNELHQNRGLVTASVSFIYKNFTITLHDSDINIIINATTNQFETTFTLKLPNSDEKDETCFFEWNYIQVQKFVFSTTATDTRPIEKLNGIASKFQKENLQEVLNSKPFLEFVNKEMSVCNKKSFIHDITSAFILIIALKGLGSMIGNLFSDIFCS